MSFRTIYFQAGKVVMLDQRALPQKEIYLHLQTSLQVARAIKDLTIRGAPAIGIAAAFGMALAAQELVRVKSPELWWKKFKRAGQRVAQTRPTAVNLAWAVARMEKKASALLGISAQARARHLLREAREILEEDIANNRKLGKNGAELIQNGDTILTHCNAGALATGGHGTALGVIRSARRQGKKLEVLADETRPFLQGARLTAWELARDKIPVTLICDSMAGAMLKQGKVDKIIVGADRIARNGDTANKVGTYALAVLAAYHKIPFYVAAPLSTIDLNCRSGKDIPMEQRSAREVFEFAGRTVAPRGVRCLNPAFDVSPARLITALITEKGVVKKPSAKKILKLFAQ